MKRLTSKEMLAASFRELAETRPIDKITTKDIAENCGYSQATFYRQFKDKYDLIAWAYTRDLEAILDELTGEEVSLKQTLLSAANYFQAHREYLSNLLQHTGGYDSFVKNMTEIHFASLRKVFLRLKGAEELDAETEMYCRIYCLGTVLFSCEWILGKYTVSVEALAQVYENALPGALGRYFTQKRVN